MFSSVSLCHTICRPTIGSTTSHYTTDRTQIYNAVFVSLPVSVSLSFSVSLCLSVSHSISVSHYMHQCLGLYSPLQRWIYKSIDSNVRPCIQRSIHSSTALHCIALLYCITMHCIKLHYIIFYCIVLSCIVLWNQCTFVYSIAIREVQNRKEARNRKWGREGRREDDIHLCPATL